MEKKSSPFAKGGCAALFLIFIFSHFISRGHFRISFFTGLIIFVIGGFIGRAIFSSHEKKEEGNEGRRESTIPDNNPPPTRVGEIPPVRRFVHESAVCEHCGMAVPPGAVECSRCGWTYNRTTPPQS
jgi:hypothetical protein